MMAKMKPYPEYKDSSLPWLGNIPSHWEVRRNGRLFAQRNQTGFPDYPILEVSLRTGVRVRDFDNLKRKQVMSDREKYKLAVKGDIAYNMMRMWQGAVGVAPVDGLISPAYVVARPYPEVYSRYYAYLFRTAAYMDEVDKYSHGIVKDRNRLYWDEFKQMPSAFPPPDEQTTIANFLDQNRVLVHRFIRNKERLIELLQEQKQAIISHAVTRGIDPDVRLKPSGIDWMGDVPEHWEVRRLKTLATIIMGQSPDSADCNIDGNGQPFLQGCAEFGEQHPSPFQYCTRTNKTSPIGSLLMSVRAPVGKTNIADQEYAIGRGLCSIIPQDTVINFEYACHAILQCMTQLFVVATGSTYDAVTIGEVGCMYLPLPPISDQSQIVRCIAVEVHPINSTIPHTRRQIDLIREYRTRLIADVVTGKLDVRDVAIDEAAEADAPDDNGFLEDEEDSFMSAGKEYADDA